MESVRFFIFPHWSIGQCEKIIPEHFLQQASRTIFWGTGCFNGASYVLAWARRGPTTSRLKLTDVRHRLQVKTGSVLETIRVLWAERGVVDGEFLANLVPTSRPQLARCGRCAPRLAARCGRSPTRKRAAFLES